MLNNRKHMILAAVAVLVVVTLGFGVFSKASQAAAIGYVDVDAIIDQYLIAQIEGPLQAETEKLQVEMDKKLEGVKEDAEKEKIFVEFQTKLDQVKQGMIDAHLPKIDSAIEAIAKDRGVEVVLDRQFILFGGTDLTEPVLLKLGIKIGSAK